MANGKNIIKHELICNAVYIHISYPPLLNAVMILILLYYLAQCPVLTSPDKGMISCTGNEFGDTCTITCDDGYELSGSETRTCQDDGAWSGTDAICIEGINEVHVCIIDCDM